MANRRDRPAAWIIGVFVVVLVAAILALIVTQSGILPGDQGTDGQSNEAPEPVGPVEPSP